MIIKCFCHANARGNAKAATYQDQHYGSGKRVANETTKLINDRKLYRCVVCGKEGTKRGD